MGIHMSELCYRMPTWYPEKECAAWRLRDATRFPVWGQPSGLAKYAAFEHGWGFLMYGGFGWVEIDPRLNISHMEHGGPVNPQEA